MNLNATKEAVTINEVIFDNQVEQSVESDLILPDYCPDIARILKCQVSPQITSSQAAESAIVLEGFYFIRIYYQTESGQIRCTEQKASFTKSVELKTKPEDPIITASVKCDYINCRVMSQRRMEIKGALTISLKVTNQKKEELLCDMEGGGVQLRKKSYTVTSVVGQLSRQFTLHDDLEIGYGKPAVAAIISYSSKAIVSDFKVISGKIIAKGEVIVRTLYLPEGEENNMEIMEHSLPISQLLDISGIDEDCMCDVRFQVVSTELQLRQDGDGEMRILSAQVTVCANARAHRNHELTAISDMYSTNFASKQSYKMINCLRLADIVHEHSLYKNSLDLPEEGVERVLDLWCIGYSSFVHVEDGKVKVGIQLEIGMFCINKEQMTAYYEKTVEFEAQLECKAPGKNILFTPDINILSTTYSLISNEKIDIRCDMKIEGCMYTMVSDKVVCDCEIDENQIKQRDKNIALTIYYADKDESVWDIAKQYNTSVRAVMEENALEEERLRSKMMLLIPMVS